MKDYGNARRRNSNTLCNNKSKVAEEVMARRRVDNPTGAPPTHAHARGASRGRTDKNLSERLTHMQRMSRQARDKRLPL
jgi:hypothetical protein